MTVYRIFLLFKFIGVMLYGGGVVARIVSTEPAAQKRVVHSVASPGLLLTWIAGYLLSLEVHVPLTELWVLGGLGLSLASQIALVRSVSRHSASPRLHTWLAALLLLSVLALMIFRPTWQGVAP
jgi:hypothetical protein